MKVLLTILITIICLGLLTNCQKHTCLSPDVIIDTLSIKFERNISVSEGSPNFTSEGSSIIATGWTRNGNLDTTRSYFTLPSLDNIDTRYKIKNAYFVWYGDLTPYYDDRIDNDTSFIYLTTAPPSAISNITWHNQPTVITHTKIPVPPPFHRIGKVKIEATEVINKIRSGTLSNHIFLFRLKTEIPYRYKSYKGLSTETTEETPSLELVLEKPLE